MRNEISYQKSTEFESLINNNSFNPRSVADTMVNGFGYNPGMHRYIQSQMFDLSLEYIFQLAIAYRAGKYDGRNEIACKNADKIVSLIQASGEDFSNDNISWCMSARFDDAMQEKKQLASEAKY